MMEKIYYGWWNVFFSFVLGFFVCGVISFGFTAFFEPLAKEFGWSYTQISFASSLRGLEMGIFAPLIGFLADRFGSRRLIFLGIITSGFGLILLAVTKSLAVYYISFLLLAFGTGGCMGLLLVTTAAKWFDKDVGKAIGIVAVSFGLGGLNVPLIVRLIDTFQWRTALTILGVGIWILGIPLALLMRDNPERYGYVPARKSLPGLGPPPEAKDTGRQIPFKEALKQKAFFYLMVAELVRHLVISAVMLHVMPYLGSVGIPRSTAGMIAGSLPVISVVGRITFGWLGDIFEKRYTMASALGLIGIGMLAYALFPHGGFIILFAVPFAAGWGGGMVTARAVLREYFGTEYFGKMLGIIMGFSSIGGIVGPTSAGWVFDHFGSYRLIWLVLFGLSLLATWLTLKMKPIARENG